MNTNEKNIVIYDECSRWVAIANLAFAGAALYCVVHFSSNKIAHYAVGGFLCLFSLFWVKDFIFGFRLRLVSDGQRLSWQEGRETGHVELRQMTAILVSQPVRHRFGWTFIRFRLSDGSERQLPPNMAQGLRARDWRRLKELIRYIQTITPVTVEPLDDPYAIIEGVTDESPRDDRG